MCGEKDHSLAFCASAEGSPPHVRGKAGPNSAHNAASGITPAYAGKRLEYLVNPFSSKDHPRVCGEKNIVRKASFDPQGSPPRMRGKDAEPDAECNSDGITPAYAGKRQSSWPNISRRVDHPRVCGEKAQTAQQTETRIGSPPRMRGKVPCMGCLAVCAGITPAYAGKRPALEHFRPQGRDHPRVCGEKTKKIP